MIDPDMDRSVVGDRAVRRSSAPEGNLNLNPPGGGVGWPGGRFPRFFFYIHSDPGGALEISGTRWSQFCAVVAATDVLGVPEWFHIMPRCSLTLSK